MKRALLDVYARGSLRGSAAICVVLSIVMSCASAPVGGGVNLLVNPEFASEDGIAPLKWHVPRGESFKGAFTSTGGVLRISECAPGYCHSVSQTFKIDGKKSRRSCFRRIRTRASSSTKCRCALVLMPRLGTNP